MSDVRFEMPEIPPDWRPRPARVWGTIRTFDDTPQVKQEPKEVIRGAPNKPLTFEQVCSDGRVEIVDRKEIAS